MRDWTPSVTALREWADEVRNEEDCGESARMLDATADLLAAKNAQIAALQAEVGRLRSALEPFAKVGDAVVLTAFGGQPLRGDEFTARDVLRASRAFAGSQEGEDRDG